MNCGINATITDYRNSKNIDVQFTNGKTRTHVSYTSFTRGSISPEPKPKPINHKNESRIMNCGLKATIIAYRTCNDMDVQFENGNIRKNVTLQNFQNGTIRDSITPKSDKYLGQTKMMKCGVKATVTKVRNYDDIDVCFENGIIKKHTCINNFKSGNIHFEDLYKKDIHLGETSMMDNGINATIIEYRTSTDIDIQFEDGTIR